MIKVKIICLFNKRLLHKLSRKFTLLISMIEKELPFTSKVLVNVLMCTFNIARKSGF